MLSLLVLTFVCVCMRHVLAALLFCAMDCPVICDNSCLCSYEPRHDISNNVVCATSKGSWQPSHTRSLIRAFASRLNIS